MDKRRTQDKLIFKVSLLSISLFLMMAPQIANALPLMYKAFPNVSQENVQMLSTVPNFGIIAGLVISPFLVRFLGEKITVLSGLGITLITGIFPMFSNVYTAILISRFLIGFGIGLFNSLAVSLIPEFYSDDEEKLASMIGFQNVMSAIGAAISSFLVSYLVTISWHAAFAIYFLVIPAFILFFAFVPMPRNHVDENGQVQTKKEKQKINGKVVLISFLMFIIFTFYMPFSFELPTLIVSEKLGNVSTPGIIAGISSLIGIPIGASFGFFFKKLHDKIFPIGFTLITIGLLITAFAPNLALLFIGIIILGFGFGLGTPYMYNWLDWAAPAGSVNLATTIVLVLVNVGCAISPTVVGFVGNLLHMNSPRGIFMISAVVFALITVYAFIHYLNVHKTDEVK